MLVLLNAGQEEGTFENIEVPAGNWRLIGNTEAVNHVKGVRSPKNVRKLKGGSTLDVEMDKTSILMWVLD